MKRRQPSQGTPGWVDRRHRSVIDAVTYGVGGGAGNRTRVRSRVKRNLYECSPGFVLTDAAPWDQAPHRPVTVCVPPAAVTPAGGEAAGISVGSGHRSRLTGRRQAVA